MKDLIYLEGAEDMEKLASYAVARNLIPFFGAGFSAGAEALNGSVPDCTAAQEYMKKALIEENPECADYLAELARRVLEQINVILITLGGETSYKCCKSINSNELKLIDEVAPAISLCVDTHGRWIVTKSGNLGNTRTLIEILDYFKHHE